MKKIKFFSVIIFFLFFATSIFAAGGSKMLLENYGGIPNVVVSSLTSDNPETAIASYIDMLIKIAFGFASIGAVILIVWGGIIYTSPAYTKKQEGKEKIIHALIAILILVGSFMVFQKVNPDALKVRFNLAKPIVIKAKITEIKRTIDKKLETLDHITDEQLDAFQDLVDESRNLEDGEYSEDLDNTTIVNGEIKYIGNITDATELSDLNRDTGLPINDPNLRINQEYGVTSYAYKNYNSKFHDGIDLNCPQGVRNVIQAVDDGKIKKLIHSNRGYGNHIIIEHDNGYTTLYGHLSQFRKEKIEDYDSDKHKEIDFKVGVKVKKGDKIGNCGSTGFSTGPHLHFVTKKNGHPFDPHQKIPELMNVKCREKWYANQTDCHIDCSITNCLK